MKKFSVSAFALCAMMVAPLAHAGLIGSVGIDYLYPNSSTVALSDTITVGGSLDCPGASPICTTYDPSATQVFGVGTTSITYSDTSDPNFYNTASFNGLEFTDLTFADSGTLSSFTLTGNTVAGLSSSDVSFTGNSIEVNLEGLAADGTFTLNLSETPATVPEPGSMALMATALAGLAVLVRRRRVKI